MQGICHLSRRWHQQFCHSPSFGPHKKCLLAFVPARHIRLDRGGRKALHPVKPRTTPPLQSSNTLDSNPLAPSNLLATNSDDLVVNEFEQFGSDSSTRRPFDPAKPVKEEAEAIWEELQGVEEQLRIARQGPFGPESPFMQRLPAEQREEVLKVLSKESIALDEEEDTLDLAELDRLMEEEEDDSEDSPQEEMKVTLRIPRAHQAYIAKFNKALAEAQGSQDDTLKNLNLWKWYLRCQQQVPGFSRIIPQQVWRFLWQSQSRLGVRQRHLVMLGRDMLAADEPMSQEQKLEFIRALHVCDDTSTALATWEDMRTQIAGRLPSDFASNFYAVGVQLYAAVGRPQKAQQVAFSALEKGAAPELLVHVVTGWARSKEPDAASKAWVAYLKMRTLLGEKMNPELYEKVSDALLDEKRNQMALAVFKDMIERIKGSGSNTLAVYQAALGSVPTDANPEEVEQAINQVSLSMLLALPRAYHNKFFFASWIKKLIGQGRIEAAAMVVDLMYERDIKPDAIHLNGIMGAWLRDRSPQCREKAVRLGHEMIQARVNQAAIFAPRDGSPRQGNVFRKTHPPLAGALDPVSKSVRLSRPVPAANHETFLLMFNYYAERHQWDEFEQLSQLMTGAAQLRPNVQIINKFLSVELEARSSARFWTLFNTMTRECQPNIETFLLAWQAVTFRSEQVALAGEARASSARQLFGRMMEWSQNLRGIRARSAREDFDAGAYSTVIRAFCYQKDLAGLICAMQGLYQTLRATPDPVSMQLIVGLTARLLPRHAFSGPTPRGRLRGNTPFRQDQTMLKGIADIIETLEAKRKIELVESGDASAEEVEDPDSEVAQRLRLDVMTEFLVVMMKKIEKADSNLPKTLRDVAQVMQVDVGHIDTDAILES